MKKFVQEATPWNKPVPWKSGLPATIPPRPHDDGRKIADAIADLKMAPEARRGEQIRRRYDRPGTDHTRRITARIIGEKLD